VKTSLRVSLLGLLAAAVVSLVGCGPSSLGATANASALKPYSLVWYMRGRGPEKDEAMVEAAANAYLKNKINATVRIVNIDREAYDGRVALAIASQSPFDICFTGFYIFSMPNYARRGAFAALNDPKENLLDTYMPGTKEALGPIVLRGAEINGVLYALPVKKELAHSNGFELRKDIIDKYSLEVSGIKTLKDLEPLLLEVKRREPRMNHPLAAYAFNSPLALLEPDALFYGPVAVYPDLKVRDFLETPETLDHFTTMRRFYQEDLIRKDAASTQDYVPDVQAGKIFALWSDTKPGGDKVTESEFGMPWYQIRMTEPRIDNADLMGAMNAISTSSKDPARAAMFLELMNTDKYLNNLINFGIEGVHYVKVSDNVIDFAPGTNEGRSSRYNPGVAWSFANQFLNYLFPNEDTDKWKKIDAYNKGATTATSLGFILDQEPVRSEIAAIDNVWQEFIPGLEVGSSDPSIYLPRAIARFKAAGLDRVIQEAQKQFDAWYAGKRQR
jgi:putative aldouronate transport system substrate-binding protein